MDTTSSWYDHHQKEKYEIIIDSSSIDIKEDINN